MPAKFYPISVAQNGFLVLKLALVSKLSDRQRLVHFVEWISR